MKLAVLVSMKLKEKSMNNTGHGSVVSPELVVMAAGVVTASDDLAPETIGDLMLTRLSHAQSGFSDPVRSYISACQGTTEAGR